MSLLGICLALGLACGSSDLPPAPPPPVVTAPAPLALSALRTEPLQAAELVRGDRFPPCAVTPPRRFQRAFLLAARQTPGVTPCELAKQAWCESRFDPLAVSPAGALGIAQFLPATAAELGVDPLDPGEAIAGMARYVAWTRDGWWPAGREHNPDIVGLGAAAYNAGRGAMFANQRRNGWYLLAEALPHLPHETQGYVPCALTGRR